MKKLVCILTTVIFLFGLCSCDTAPSGSQDRSEVSSVESMSAESTSENDETSTTEKTKKTTNKVAKKTTKKADKTTAKTKKTTSRTTENTTRAATKKSSKTTAKTKTPATKTTNVITNNVVTNKTTAVKTTQRVTSVNNTYVNDDAYEDIACAEIFDFQQISLTVKSSDVIIFLTIPKEWELEKSNNGYNIVKESKVIGSVAISSRSNVNNKAVNVFYGEITTDDMKISHSIDRVESGKDPSYTRTLCYNYDEERGDDGSVSLTVAYQELDSDAVYKMMTESSKLVSASKNNMGVLELQDDRNSVLILGNSFVNTSCVGDILQTMCGSKISVEAHSRGYATVQTYSDDAYMLGRIRSGNFSAVFMCGLYSATDAAVLKNIVNACEISNTKLAIFPAHNESRTQINKAAFLYPNAVLIDWKAEIDALIGTGIDRSYFCIADAHKHSTSLAGYVGAHMIYRAIFNEIPQQTSFAQVPQTRIALLGNYVRSGSVVLRNESAAYVIE